MNTPAPPPPPEDAAPVPAALASTGPPHLEPARIIETVRALADRIEERFPGSGLGRVARQMLLIARSTAARIEWASQPILWVRVGVGLALLLLLGLIASLAVRINLQEGPLALPDFLQATEAATNELIVLGGTILFMMTAEARIKRRKALAALRDLRALAHIVDMHQLTKDPDRHLEGRTDETASSPRRTYTRFELSRYLDYCSEMLALNSKLAALYAQNSDDPVVLAAVDEVEDLTTGLCAKIWQKLVILNRAAPD